MIENQPPKKLTIKLKKFTINQLPPSPAILVIGKRKTGKTSLVIDLLKRLNIDRGAIIDPCKNLKKPNQNYEEIVPKAFVLDQYRDRSIDVFLEYQQKYLDLTRSRDSEAFLVLDNCMYDDQWQKADGMKDIIYNGRHHHITLLMTMGCALGITIGVRNNLDFVFLFKNAIHADKRRLYEYFGHVMPTYAVFSAIFDMVTHDHGCLVLDVYSAPAKHWTDKIFWYKIDLNADVFFDAMESFEVTP